MTPGMQFDELLDAVEHLPEDAQADFVEVVRHRLAERGRERIVEEVRQAREEFAAGKCAVSTPEDIMREIDS